MEWTGAGRAHHVWFVLSETGGDAHDQGASREIRADPPRRGSAPRESASAQILHHDLSGDPVVVRTLLARVARPDAIAGYDDTLWCAYRRRDRPVYDLYRMRMRRHPYTDQWYASPWGRLEPAGSVELTGALVAMGADRDGVLLVEREGDRFWLRRGPGTHRGSPAATAPPLLLPLPATASSWHIVTGLHDDLIAVIAERAGAGSDVIRLHQRGGELLLNEPPMRLDDHGDDTIRFWTVSDGRLMRVRHALTGRLQVDMIPAGSEVADIVERLDTSFTPGRGETMLAVHGSGDDLIAFTREGKQVWRRRIAFSGLPPEERELLQDDVPYPATRRAWPAALAVAATALLFGLEGRRAAALRAVDEHPAGQAPGTEHRRPALVVHRAAAMAIDFLPFLIGAGYLLGGSPLDWLGITGAGVRTLLPVWLLAAAATCVVGGFAEWRFGRSPGKALLHLRVMPEAGPDAPVRVVRRAAWKGLSIACPLLLIAGILHPSGRCLHDVFGASVVCARSPNRR